MEKFQLQELHELIRALAFPSPYNIQALELLLARARCTAREIDWDEFQAKVKSLDLLSIQEAGNLVRQVMDGYERLPEHEKILQARELATFIGDILEDVKSLVV